MSSLETDEFWTSLDGLVLRAELVAQDFVWGLWNSLTQVTAEAQNGQVQWVCDWSGKVCDDCAGYENTYDANDPDLPELPVHPNCHCQLLVA